MEKNTVVLVVLNRNALGQALQSLNLAKVNLVAIVADGGDGRAISLGNKIVPLFPFAAIQTLLDAGKNFLWLISGSLNGVGDLWKVKKFLKNRGIPEDNIVNFEILPHLSNAWLANLRYIETNGADFFATGISYAEVGLDFKYIAPAHSIGVNLAGSNQDLRQGYLTAKHVFERVAPGTIKFVLIGLTPYSFRYSNAEAFSVCSRNLQYMLALDEPPVTLQDKLLNFLVSDAVKTHFLAAGQADLNFDAVKAANNVALPAKALIDWEAELDNLTKKLRPQVIERNFQILKDYIKLCRDNGAQPVGVVLPFAPAMYDNYSAELLTLFRLALRQLEFPCIDLFDLKLGYDCFYNMAHLNLRGAAFASSLLSLRLYGAGLLSPEHFCGMNYAWFDMLANFLAKDDYNRFIERVFTASEQAIRRKDKIKVGFVTREAAEWCGDNLYNYFANDERFETTVFLCLRMDKPKDELVRKDFARGVEQFKTRGLNVMPLAEQDSPVPDQDVLILLTPYFHVLPNAFRLNNLTARTLLYHIPYGFSVSKWDIYNTPVFHVCRKFFADTQYYINVLERKCRTGMPRGVFGGYPKLDSFFKPDMHFKFDWKMARPDAKKIIYAPHWSIKSGIKYATFQWNYRFMYDFAKAHPEISWVVKPHPNLLFSAVESGLFPSTEAFEEYLQAWNDLPNAQVYTGAYYQALFATSDGMIHDSGSFIIEYQYVNKPMIFLRRDTQEFNDLGAAILNVSYLVDGKDLQGIAELMKSIFLMGNDPKRDERQKFFDEHLNYFKHNGMTASEFIYRNIAQELDS